MGNDGDLFEDAENDPLWQAAGLLADAPPRPASKGHGRLFAAVAGAGAARGPHADPARRGPADLPGVSYAPEKHCRPVQWRAAETRHQPIDQISGFGGLREAGVIAIEESEHQALGAGDFALVPLAADVSPARTRVPPR